MARNHDFFLAEPSICAQRRLSAAGIKLDETRIIIKKKIEEHVQGKRVTAKFVRSIVVHCMSAGEVSRAAPMPFRLFHTSGPNDPVVEIIAAGGIIAAIGYREKYPVPKAA